MRYFILCLFLTAQTFGSVDEFTKNINSASNSKLRMSSRWGALIQAAKVASFEQLEQIRKFSESKEWYMRNAALVALSKISQNAAMTEAKKLLYDKSLVVRSAAVEIIGTHMNVENKSILATEMTKAYNFHKSSSLWIRKQIVEKMSEGADITDRDFFVRGLFDSDKEIAQMSAKILSIITGEQVDGTKQVEKWQELVKQNQWRL